MHHMDKIPETATPELIALQIRDFPADIARRMRAYAELKGISTREVVVAALAQYLPEFSETAGSGVVVEISR